MQFTKSLRNFQQYALFFIAAVFTAQTSDPGFAAEHSKVSFNRDIRPILSENCFYCHGAAEDTREADLRLDDRAAAIDSEVLAPKRPNESTLLERINSTDESSIMPPADSNRSLSVEQKQLIKSWIEQGAPYEKHWAFNRPEAAATPVVSQPDWVHSSLDAFVLARLDSEKLNPTKEASPSRWLRRVSLDLIGVPPTPEETDAFCAAVKSKGELAYEEVVDTLLNSPHYGERMTIDWLDVARYADTHGFNNDSRRSMWRWRDWVIESFNRNQPYDEFITEQLAGDLLPNPTLDQRIATGFNRNHVINSEGGIIDEEYQVEYVADRVRTTSMAWLGLTFECAKCHDHKYDSITQENYYQLFAFFNNVKEWGEDGRVANAPPLILAPTSKDQQKIKRFEQQIEELRVSLKSHEASWQFKPDSQGSRLLQHLAGLKSKKTNDFALSLASQIGVDPNASFDETKAKFNATEKSDLRLSSSKIRLNGGDPHSWEFWINPDKQCPEDTPLLSSIDYGASPSAQTYGRGFELRLVNGEIEFRMSKRFPVYSIVVQTRNANIRPGEWKHVALVYQGAVTPQVVENQRSRAEWLRVYINGEQADLKILHDDLQYTKRSSRSLSSKALQVGRSRNSKDANFVGSLADLKGYGKALSLAEVLASFQVATLQQMLCKEATGKLTKAEKDLFGRVFLDLEDEAYRTQQSKLRAAQASKLNVLMASPTVMVMQEIPNLRETHILERGLYDNPGKRVEASVPEELLLAFPEDMPKNRLGLARWITHEDHPLTARVVVNRFWQQIFGIGIVKTSEDFGVQGEWPSHPELLDFLARDFIDSGWDVKRLIKQIVLSSTYRQDSDTSKELLERDPENRLLARGPRFRLPAELLRDQALDVSGLLKEQVGGPSVFPYQPDGLYKGIVVGQSYPGSTWTNSTGEGLYRRSLYTFWKRTAPYPAMINFDAPDREFCTVRRSQTNTPLQALQLLNDPAYVEASRKLAERLLNRAGMNDTQRIRYGFEIVTLRKINQDELLPLVKLLQTARANYAKNKEAAQKLIAIGESKTTFDNQTELASWTILASVLFNLDETITRN